jgi:hypothetical protein
MSGMFQRIARRQADGSDESAPVDPAAEPATTEVAPGEDVAPAVDDSNAESATEVAPDPADATVEVPVVDAPTERIEAVTAPPTDPPPPVRDLTTKLPVTPAPQPEAAGPVQPAAAERPATAEQPPAAEQPTRRPGFRARGRMRRRLRYLRKLRELQVRDLGGLAFDLRRFERKRDDLVARKIDQIRACDDELHALELALDERRDLRDVREPGIGGTCPRCFAIYGSADKFCANCGAAFGGAVQGPAAQVPLTPPASPAPPPASGPGGSGSQA